jgi:hypothetical protein
MRLLGGFIMNISKHSLVTAIVLAVLSISAHAEDAITSVRGSSLTTDQCSRHSSNHGTAVASQLFG